MSRIGVYLTDYQYITHAKEISGEKLATESQLTALRGNETQVEIIDISTDTTAFLTRVHACIPFSYVQYNWSKICIPAKADFVYIKRISLDYPFVKLLSRMKSESPNIKIVLEIPDDALLPKKATAWYQKALQRKAHFYCKQLKKYVDRIVTYTNDEQIYTIPCINIYHGIDFQAVLPREAPPAVNNPIQLLVISEFLSEYQYERLLEGLFAYNTHTPTDTVHIHFVGYGPMINTYKQRIAVHKLENNVTFHGVNDEQFRERLYGQCHLGVDFLGGITQSGTRGGEFLARGLPYITTQAVPPCGQQFAMTLPNNATPVDIERVLGFYRRLCASGYGHNLATKIRSAAQKELDIRTTFQPVIDFLNNLSAR